MVHFIGNRWVRSCDMRFRKKEDIPFLILIGSIISGKDATKHDFNIARTPATLYYLVAPFKGTLEET